MMADYQWLVIPAVAIVAVLVTFYLGKQNLRNVVAQRERESNYASGRIDAKLENLEHIWRGVDEKLRGVDEKLRGVDDRLRGVDEKLDAHDVLLRQLHGEAKKQNRRLRKLRQRVEVLEPNPTEPPTNPPAGPARVIELAEQNFGARRGRGSM